MPHATEPTWQIGELARAAGLTVRTLHHYEQLGLLAPHRTEGNHRVYDADDVKRLYRILALRDLGVPLGQIATTLEGRGVRDLLVAQIERLDHEMTRLADLRARLIGLTDTADAAPEALLGTMEAMRRVTAHVERQRRRGPFPPAIPWKAMGTRLRAALVAGTPADAPSVQAIAADIRDGIASFAGRDPDVIDALAQIRKHAPPTLPGWDPELFRYLDAALAALDPGHRRASEP